MTAEEFRDLYACWWHAAIPPFSYVGILSLINETPKDFNLTDQQYQAVERINQNRRKVAENWGFIPHHKTLNAELGQDFLEFFLKFWEDGFVPVNAILTDVDALLTGALGEINLDRDLVRYLRRGSRMIKDDWLLPFEYMNLHFNLERVWTWEPLLFAELVEAVLNYLRERYDLEDVRITLANDIPPIRGNAWLIRALSYMVSFPECRGFRSGRSYIFSSSVEWSDALATTVEDYIPSIEAELTKDLSTILVRIRTGLVSHGIQKEASLNSSLFNEGSCPAIAGYIIEKYDQQGKFYWSYECSEFLFTLPLWNREFSNSNA